MSKSIKFRVNSNINSATLNIQRNFDIDFEKDRIKEDKWFAVLFLICGAIFYTATILKWDYNKVCNWSDWLVIILSMTYLILAFYIYKRLRKRIKNLFIMSL